MSSSLPWGDLSTRLPGILGFAWVPGIITPGPRPCTVVLKCTLDLGAPARHRQQDEEVVAVVAVAEDEQLDDEEDHLVVVLLVVEEQEQEQEEEEERPFDAAAPAGGGAAPPRAGVSGSAALCPHALAARGHAIPQ